MGFIVGFITIATNNGRVIIENNPIPIDWRSDEKQRGDLG